MPHDPKDIEVEMTFLRTEEGGRQHPMFSGYQPQFYYDGTDSSARHNYIDVKVVCPGQTVRAYLTFLSPDYHVGKISVGMEFLVREGARTIARGRILEILELEKSAAEAVRRKTQQHA